MCPCCCCYWRTASETSALDGVVRPKNCVWQLTQFLLPGKEIRLNRISHPDWVKLCVELICTPNQNSFCYRSISFRESMPLPSNSAITDQSTDKAHWFLLSLEVFFLVPFGRADNLRQPLASSPNRHLSDPLQLIPLGTTSLKITLLLASHTLPTNPGPTY